MKFSSVLIAATLFLSANAQAFQSKIEVVERFDNTKMVAFINPEDISESPLWDSNADESALTMHGAIQAVRRFSNSKSAIQEISMRPVPQHEEHWYYLVKMADEKMRSKSDIYVVLMSGKVIPAIAEPEGYK